ncbi:MAG: hypothetical protein AAFW75_23640 [Cyanobacteria bacterium J06636_16]
MRYLGLKRRVTATIPIAIAQAKKNLSWALHDTVTLRGQWQLTRRYWGHLNRDRLTLHGPRANRQLCFFTRGYLRPGETPNQTHLDLEIVLGEASEIQLLMGIVIAVVIPVVMFRLFGLLIVIFFLALVYGTTQWNFTYYAAEIRQLLCDRIVAQHNET